MAIAGYATGFSIRTNIVFCLKPLLSILIPTITGREVEFNRLCNHLFAIGGNYIEVLQACDNKEMSIGAKRQLLLEAATSTYFVMIDDDDMVPPFFVDEVSAAIIHRPDCITYRESVRLAGREYTCNHALKYNDWGDKVDGYDFVRTPYYKDVLRTDLALQVGFKDMRYGEDHDFARRIKPLLKTEVHINKIMYYYYGQSLTPQQHKNRYGIR